MHFQRETGKARAAMKKSILSPAAARGYGAARDQSHRERRVERDLQHANRRHYLLASDFDQTLSFNEERVAELASDCLCLPIA